MGSYPGVFMNTSPGARTGWADVRYEIDYRAEVQPGHQAKLPRAGAVLAPP